MTRISRIGFVLVILVVIESKIEHESGQSACERRRSIYRSPITLHGKPTRLCVATARQAASATRARVVKWQTRTFEGRMPKGMGVQVPPRAPLGSRAALQSSVRCAQHLELCALGCFR